MATNVENYGNIAWVKVTYREKTHTLSEWSKILGISYDVLRMRYKRGHRGSSLFYKHGQIVNTIDQINVYVNQLRRQQML